MFYLDIDDKDSFNFLKKETIVQTIICSCTKVTYETNKMFV
jgi:hypothetical protein